MTTYAKLTDFASKDALLTGNPSKLVKGVEIGAEFDALVTSDASNVKGPSTSVTDLSVPRWDTTTGRLLKSTGVTIDNSNIITASAFAGSHTGAATLTTLTVTGDSTLASINGGQLAGLRNRIINGDMRVAQRGTSVASPANLAYVMDRWFNVFGAANRTYTQLSDIPGFGNAIRCQRVAADTAVTPYGVTQIIEWQNIADLQGKTVTISYTAYAGANYSATSSLIAIAVVSGTVADQGSGVYWSPGWTGATAPLSTSVTLTGAAQRFSHTCTIPSGCKELAIGFTSTPTGTAGANDYFEVTGVQLEPGSVATPFEQRPIGLEEILCKRYCEKLGGITALTYLATVSADSAASFFGVLPFKVAKRSVPTSVTVLGANTDYTLYGSGINSNPTSLPTVSSFSEISCVISGACTTTAGYALNLRTGSINGGILINSEL
jgi:hypothetical protein